MKRHVAALLTFSVVGITAVTALPTAGATPDDCAPGNPLLPQAEMFATNNTYTISDAADPRMQDRLESFGSQVDGTILANGAIPVGSDLVDGVFWSEHLQDLTFEPSREFHVACVDERELTDIASTVASQFDQESVLTFAYLPDDAPSADSFIAEVPGVDVRRFYDALAADPDARTRLGGGSVTEDGTLVLVAAAADADMAKRVVAKAGGQLDMTTVRWGRSSHAT